MTHSYRQRGSVLAGVLLLAATLPGQFIDRGKDPVDVLPLAPWTKSEIPHLEWSKPPRSHIVNPGFFCTSCAKEKRIRFRKRSEMEEVLSAGFPIRRPNQRRKTPFRLMGEPGPYVLRYLFDEMEPEHPVYIEDHLFRLFCDLGPGDIARPNKERTALELEALRQVFPKLSATTSRLTSHQRAHLYLIRAHRVLRDVLNLVDFKENDSYFWRYGPYLGNRQKFEIYLFDRQKTLSRFITAYRGNYEDLFGFDYYIKKDEANVMAACPPKARDHLLNATFTHRLAVNLLAGYRGRHQFLPAWLFLAFGHLLERRESGRIATLVLGDQPARAGFDLRSFQDDVVRRVKANKYPPFASLCKKTMLQDVSVRLRPVIWSQLRYLLSLGRPEFARFIGRMKAVMSGKSTIRTQLKAFKDIYHLTPEEFEEGWRAWVLEGMPGVPRSR